MASFVSSFSSISSMAVAFDLTSSLSLCFSSTSMLSSSSDSSPLICNVPHCAELDVETTDSAEEIVFSFSCASDLFEDGCGELHLDELEWCPEWELAELFGDDADEREAGDSSLIMSELGEDKLLECIMLLWSAVWLGLAEEWLWCFWSWSCSWARSFPLSIVSLLIS